jgi:hypothetical protein
MRLPGLTKAQGIVLRMVRSLMAADPVLAAWAEVTPLPLVVEGFRVRAWAS